MKLLSGFLIFFLMEMYDGRRISIPQDGIRIPLTRIDLMSENLDSGITDETPTIPLNHSGSTFYGNVTIGTDQVRLQFDTGSSVLWVFSSDYKKLGGDHKKYNHKNSKNYTKDNTHQCGERSYMKSKINGYWSKDHVSITNGIQIPMRFIEVTNVTDGQINNGYDGIMGLQYNSKYDEYVTKFCMEGSRKFSYHLPRTTNNSKNPISGNLTLCGQDKKYMKDLKYVDDIGDGTWHIQIKSVRLLESLKNRNLAVIDTGSNAIYGPENTILTFYNETNISFNEKSGFPRINCTYINKNPFLQFHINGINYTLSGNDCILQTSKENCFVYLLPWNGGRKWILGEPFLRKFYTVFDIDHSRIGFAENNK